MKETVGERIKELRGLLGLSQEDFAKPLKVNRSTISIWENGITGIWASNLKKISKTYNVNMDWLLNAENPTFIQQDNSSHEDNLVEMPDLTKRLKRDLAEKEREISFLKEIIEDQRKQLEFMRDYRWEKVGKLKVFEKSFGLMVPMYHQGTVSGTVQTGTV